ncbi:hypothetical protein MN0502_20520 [Arthrobacter sp. MN05-02]|nr:hypothetical protein MN0502_20520 [Arthrobacter sp. MN05-02]
MSSRGTDPAPGLDGQGAGVLLEGSHGEQGAVVLERAAEVADGQSRCREGTVPRQDRDMLRGPAGDVGGPDALDLLQARDGETGEVPVQFAQ